MLWRTPSARFWRNLPAGFIQPCQPTLVANPPAGPGWLHEVKHDGFRILARKQGEDVAVWSRRGALFNDKFHRIAEAVGALPVDNALIDGEAVVFLPDGHSDFAALLTKAGGEQASFVAFDLLSLEADDLRQRALEERRDALAAHPRRRRRRVQRSPGDRRRDRVRPRLQARLEGIVSKRAGSRYRSGTTRNWLKCLNQDFQRR
jgi:bifunctional non-homologous end joining protein LigD